MVRRLAAILAADVVGYSKLMAEDEAGTLAALKAHRAELFDPETARHNGRIVKLMGDGALVEFSSVVDAAECALAIQTSLAASNGPIRLRIGINLGDIIIDGEDIYGDGVNVAARLETLATPGGICISSVVHESLGNRIEADFEDAGKHHVKNIARPIRVWHWQPDAGARQPTATAPALDLPSKPSIAVLPFDNMSGDPEQDYFADGIVEDIITAFSRIKWLFVIARNSSFTYKGKAVDIKQVGRELGVRYVLEGSVRKAGQRIRITGQLIDTATGAHLWADRFDGELANIFDLQDRVTQSVVGTIEPKLEQAEIDRARRKPTESLDAYDYYLRGMAAFHQLNRTANREAVKLFSRAFELDPDYAAAYGMAARAHAQRKGLGLTSEAAADRAEAVLLARKAARLGRDDAIALTAAGFALVMFGEVAEGDALIDRALAVNPNLATAWNMSAWSKALMGAPELVVERGTRALRLSPQDLQTFAMKAVVGMGHYMTGNYEEAYRWAKPPCASNRFSTLPPVRWRPARCGSAGWTMPRKPWRMCAGSIRNCAFPIFTKRQTFSARRTWRAGRRIWRRPDCRRDRIFGGPAAGRLSQPLVILHGCLPH